MTTTSCNISYSGDISTSSIKQAWYGSILSVIIVPLLGEEFLGKDWTIEVVIVRFQKTNKEVRHVMMVSEKVKKKNEEMKFWDFLSLGEAKQKFDEFGKLNIFWEMANKHSQFF